MLRPQTCPPSDRRAGLPLVIAHRGASGLAPENTLLAVATALTLGADMVEVDLQLSRDGHLVLFHDPTLRRTARFAAPRRLTGPGRGSAVRLADLTLEEIKQLDVGSWYAPVFSGLTVPTLTELLEHCAGRMGLNLELKVTSKPGVSGKSAEQTRDQMAIELCRIVQAHAAWDSVLISSYDYQVLTCVRKRAPGAKLGLLIQGNRGQAEVNSALRPAEVLKVYSLHLPARLARPALIASIHQQGYRVYVYTINRATAMRRLIAEKVDGIITDYPDRLRAVLDRPLVRGK